MNSRERVLATIDHKEPDRVPVDFAQTIVSGINVIAYGNLIKYLGMKERPVKYLDIITQITRVDEDVLEYLGVDVRGVFMDAPTGWTLKIEDAGDYTFIVDPWDVVWRMPKKGGHYYDFWKHPLRGEDPDDIDNIKIVDPNDKKRAEPLLADAKRLRAENEFFITTGGCAYSVGFLQQYQALQGFEDSYINIGANPVFTEKLMDKIEDLEIQFWDWFLPEVKDQVDMIFMADDYAGQKSMLISPESFRKFFKPRLGRVFQKIKSGAPGVKIFFHSCGAIRDIIPDLIEIGVDILNPIQYNARGMELTALKKDFGRDLTFWGGAVNPQETLPRGTPAQVKEEVKRNLDILMPGGGYVFNSVHDIQSDVPPENIMAMIEAVQEAGSYR